MFKIILLSCLASALGLSHTDGQKAKLYSLHTSSQPGSLNLTTGELKVFSGHAMNIIASKCPAVDSNKIKKVQKYIAKLIAKNDPILGTSKDFKGLLATMTTCAKEGVIPRQVEPEIPASFFPFFNPFHRVRNVFVQRFQKTDEHHGGSMTNAIQTPIVDEGSPIVTPLNGEDKPSDPNAPPSTPTRRVITTTIFVRPQDMQEGIRNSGGFVNWIHKIFSRVGNFFKKPFGLRSKRNVIDFPEDEPKFDVIEAKDETAPITETETIPIPEIPDIPVVAPYQVSTPEKDDSKGKRAFGALVDQLCRIYCDTCSGKKETRQFKMAAKQLLSQLFEDDSGLEIAAKQYIDDDFLASIEKCD